MPYVVYPTWARRSERLALLSRYAPVMGLAMADLLVYDGPIPGAVSLLAVLASAAAAIGVGLGRFHIEWVGMSILVITMLAAIGFMMPYVSGAMTWLSISLTLSFGDRWVRLLRESWMAREELHRARGLEDGE